jgi:integrase/recombinase XerC
LRTYRAHLDRYARWLGVPLPALPHRLLDGGPAEAHLEVERYRAYLREERGVAPATINGSLAAIRSLVRFLRRSHLCSWALDAPAERSRPDRDTRGPGLPAVQRLLKAAEHQENRQKAARDVAIVRLLVDRALRRGELLALDAEHVEWNAEGAPIALLVRGKGYRDRERLTLPPKSRAALSAWLTARGTEPGPLFIALDPGAGRAGRGGRARPLDGRLTGEGVARILASLARPAGVAARVRPHGIRHTAITAVLDGGADLRSAQRFSRHADPRTLMRYDDNRTDIAGELATKLSDQLT